MSTSAAAPIPFNLRRFLVVAGPGLVVMLADTDAGSVITAAQSGAQWRYNLLLLQFILIPILYIVQELTVRLGVATGKGHAAPARGAMVLRVLCGRTHRLRTHRRLENQPHRIERRRAGDERAAFAGRLDFPVFAGATAARPLSA